MLQEFLLCCIIKSEGDAMKIGFTGTRRGMTRLQAQEVFELLAIRFSPSLPPREVHHGDCIGADAEAHAIAEKCSYMTIAHPASDVAKKFRANTKATYVYEPQPALRRNHDIVDLCDVLIACPGEMHEILRSGTWATIRYAKSVGKDVRIIYPRRY